MTADQPKPKPSAPRSGGGRAVAKKPLPPGQRPLQFALLALAAATLWHASIALYAGLGYGLSADLRDRLYTGMATAPERAALKRARMDILTVWNAWLPYDDLAQITLADAVEAGIGRPRGRAMMPEVMRLEAEALRRNPANAYAWARLAYARYVYNGPSRLVTEPLLQSILSAPYEPQLMASRIVLALKTEKYWPPELRALFPEQLRRAWLRNSVETVHAAYQDGIEHLLREKLAGDRVKRAHFDALLADIAPSVSGVNRGTGAHP